MKNIWGVMSADIKERSRQFSFVAMIMLALFGAFFFVPRNTDGAFVFIELMADTFIQGSNITWIPITSAWGLGFFMYLIGFFYLRASINYDERKGINQLVATSPTSNLQYMFGKFFSGVFLLAVFSVITIIGSYFMTLIHFPGESLSLRAFLAPFSFMIAALPITSALAIFFGSFRWFRGAIASTVFVFGSFSLIGIMLEMSDPNPILFLADRGFTGILQRSFDFTGTSYIQNIMRIAVFEETGGALTSLSFMAGAMPGITDFGYDIAPTTHLFFRTIPLGVHEFIGYGLMIGYALALIIFSAPLYHFSKYLPTLKIRKTQQKDRDYANNITVSTPQYFSVTPINKQMWHDGIIAELKLMLGAQSRMWKIIAVAGVGLSFFLKIDFVQIYLIPLLMLWFINVFSAMGSREHKYDILKVISTFPNGRTQQIIYSWISGLIISFGIVLPITIRMLLLGQTIGVFAALAGAVFIPSLALFLGEFTKTSRAFEMLIIVMTYLALNDMTVAMYMGIHPGVLSAIRALAYFVVGAVLGSIAVMKRIKM